MSKKLKKSIIKKNSKRIAIRLRKKSQSSNNDISKKNIRKLNPNFLYFNLDSFFIYETRLYKYFYSLLKDHNDIKPLKNDIDFLYNKIQDLKLLDYHKSNLCNIYIPIAYANFFKQMEKRPVALNEKEKKVEKIFLNYKSNKAISCQKIAKIYENENNSKISISTVYRILKNKLNFSFRKTKIKTNKLESIDSIKQTFFVLNIFIKGLKLGAEFVFLDESGFYKCNDNLKMWRRNDQDIYYKIGDNKKLNLLLAVTSSKVIHYKITKEATNSENFENFMNELNKKLTPIEKKNIFFLWITVHLIQLQKCSNFIEITNLRFYLIHHIEVPSIWLSWYLDILKEKHTHIFMIVLMILKILSIQY